MCGICVLLGLEQCENKSELRKKIVSLAQRLRHRGPDWSGIEVQDKAILAHERLAIIDPESGHQPLLDDSTSVALCVNGEIYNYEQLRTEFKDYPFRTGSDCEVILPLYKKYGTQFMNKLEGMFAFVMSEQSGKYMIARDPIGVIPLYIGWDVDGHIWVASEMKAICDVCTRIEVFPPGHYMTDDSSDYIRYYNPLWREIIPTTPADLQVIRESFEKSVISCMMSDVPWGVLLSGGLDSSLVASIAMRHIKKEKEGNWPVLHSFSIGLEGSPDLKAAREVATYLGTHHHEYKYTIQEGLDVISDVIYHLETYDCTTIRASTPMFLMARKIKAMGVKMVISGEGADEIFGGYLYFHKAPSKEALHKETVSKLDLLHYYDCLRANKALCSWGVEGRVPFLERSFLDVAMSVDPIDKLSSTHPGEKRMEKWLLRSAFDTPEDPYLPNNILWRQKEQFSDGVGYGWIDALRDLAENEVTDQQMKTAPHRFPINTPKTKEQYLYRSIFSKYYPTESEARTVPGGPSVACSTPAAVEWDLAFKKMVATNGECSGRAVSGVHEHAYKDGEGARIFKATQASAIPVAATNN
ncbi:hypothetical protein WA158_008478 [Blastocystis sp. Blastoise]